MSARGHNALRGSRALFRPLSYARHRDMIKEEPGQTQKPKGKRTTRPWPSGVLVPGAKAARLIPADQSAKCTTIRIPNTSTAFSQWPTLNNFKPALQPRANGTIPPGASSGVQATVDTDLEMAILPYLYNDLGVLIFEGPQWEQGRRKKRSITPNGLYNLTNAALKKWKADGIGGSVPVKTVPGSVKMYIVNHVDGPGLANDTINGSYLPQLHVYVATGIQGNTIYMSIEFHTVGTRRLVGVTNLKLSPAFESSSTKDTTEKPSQGVDRNTDFGQKFASVEEKMEASRKGDTSSLKQASQPPPTQSRSMEAPWELYEKLVPSNARRNSELYRRAMFKVYKLEFKLWAQRRRALKKQRKEERRTRSLTKRHKNRMAAVAQIEEKYLDADGEA
ncbi:hypothetical protein FBULB1_12099 [Fusarium bulbicola]|nr:hypothetical protein FBULB1_12099 [Fusarium bulbicola]